MQENVLALMQMAKTTLAVDALQRGGHPVHLGALAPDDGRRDGVLRRPRRRDHRRARARSCRFAGPRVVQQTTREKLPDDFGLAESNFRFGHIDMVVPRHELRGMLARLLRLFAGGEFVYAVAERARARSRPACSAACCTASGAARTAPARTNGGRHRKRRAIRAPRRCAGASPSARPSRTSGMRSSSPATTSARTRSTTPSGCSTTSPSCTAIAPAARIRRSWPGSAASAAARSRSSGHQKGRDLKQRAYRNFGSARPEGYGKAIRVFELASRLGFPVLTFVDTQGAHPGVSSEERGQAGAIARSMLAMGRLSVPVGRRRDRRGRLRRRARDRGRRPRADDGELGLLGDLARGRRGDPLEATPTSAARPPRRSSRRRASASSSA